MYFELVTSHLSFRFLFLFLFHRLPPHLFPAIFGPNEDMPLDLDTVKSAFASLTQEINAFFASTNTHTSTKTLYTPEEVALGFLRVANEAMARPIRNLTTNRGHALPRHVLGMGMDIDISMWSMDMGIRMDICMDMQLIIPP
ncbi:hypothetical protein EON63_22600 [archaeon]|nr:MAG: hypothetical protein EON63_22600 [archaeon]